MSSVNQAVAIPQGTRGRRTNHGASTMLAASLSIGAAAIHLAAASSHAEPLGDLALGFYWAALFQVAFAVALLARPRSRQLARIGVGINLAFVGVWAWSRTIGLPLIAGGPEPVGMADATTVAFQIVLVSMLAARLGVLGTSPGKVRSAANRGLIARSVFVVGLGLVVLSTTTAMADGLDGHGHHSGAAHAHPEDHPALIEPGPSETPHGHEGATTH